MFRNAFASARNLCEIFMLQLKFPEKLFFAELNSLILLFKLNGSLFIDL